MTDTPHTEKVQVDSRSTDELIRLALTEEGDDARWKLVYALHKRGTREVFDAARELCGNPDPVKRKLGAEVLGTLGSPERAFPDETLEILLPMLEAETNVDVLSSVCFALGHLHDTRAIEPLSRLKNHSDEGVRYGVVFGLIGHENALAVRTLIELSRDEAVDARNWATFGLARQLDLDIPDIDPDTPEIREALYARITDPVPEVRGEAFLGLALRGDSSIVQPLAYQLSHIEEVCPVGEVYDDFALGLMLEAAKELCHPALLPVLLDLKERYLGGDPFVEEAILSIPLWAEAVGRGAWIGKANLRLKEPIDGEAAKPLPHGYRGFLRVEGREDLWPFRIVWGPVEVEPDVDEDLRLDLGMDVTLPYQQVGEDLTPFDVVEGKKTIGRGHFNRIWQPQAVTI